MTEIASLGEFGLIKRLTADLKTQNASTIAGVGDDCAILDHSGKRTLVTTDLLMEGIHFDLIYTPLKHLGYKAAVVNFSDICAMNGTPQQLLVSLGVDNRLKVEDLDQIYDGLKSACLDYGVDLVGGDTSASLTGLTLSLTCIGQADADQIAPRSGAKENDLLCVSGDLGAAYVGLRLLEIEKNVYLQQVKEGKTARGFQPDFAGKEYLLQRILRPAARMDILQQLRDTGIQPTAMIDISDGLSSETLHLCEQSQMGCALYSERIPLHEQTVREANRLQIDAMTCALNGGEDYELLFTVPLADYERLNALPDVHIIGHIQRPELGRKLVTPDGQEINLTAQGWNQATAAE